MENSKQMFGESADRTLLSSRLEIQSLRWPGRENSVTYDFLIVFIFVHAETKAINVIRLITKTNKDLYYIKLNKHKF